MKLTMNGDRILVKPLKQEEVKKGGLVIPASAGNQTCQGEVMAVGAGARDAFGQIIPMCVQVGATVLYMGGFPYQSVHMDEMDYVVMRESDVIAAVEG